MIRSGYYDRGSGVRGAFVALCDPCGVARWGDPFDGDGMAAFNARVNDQSGDWCWCGGIGGMVTVDGVCSQCGGDS